MRHKSTFYGNWYESSAKRSDSSKRVYKEHATTSSRRLEMEARATNRLVDDIYFRTLPKVTRRIARDISEEAENEVDNFIIPKFGRKNVVYDPMGHPEERLPKQSIALNHGTFITPEGYRKGIPVWEFIKWYILYENEECDTRISAALEEWSGIPAYLHKATYNGLINALRSFVQKEHDNEDKYDHGEIHIKLYLG